MTGLVVAGTLVVPASAAAAPTRPAAATAGSASIRATTAAPAVTTTPRIRYLSVLASGGAVTMPARLYAGTYYVHVTTTNQWNRLQVVRPPRGLTKASFYALYRAWWTTVPRGSAASRAAFTRWSTSVTFVGGATVSRDGDSFALGTPRGIGTFAITLSPGRYWFFTSSYGGPRGTAAQIREVTVVGTWNRATVPVAAVARFTPAGTVTMTRKIPTSGFVLGVGVPGQLSVLGFARLLPGLSDDDLALCLLDGLVGPPPCFDGDGQLGGEVSGGASALWYYRLSPGDYVVFQGGQPLDGGFSHAVRISVG